MGKNGGNKHRFLLIQQGKSYCTKCRKIKPLSNFWKHGTKYADGSDKYQTWCKECGNGRKRRTTYIATQDVLSTGKNDGWRGIIETIRDATDKLEARMMEIESVFHA